MIARCKDYTHIRHNCIGGLQRVHHKTCLQHRNSLLLCIITTPIGGYAVAIYDELHVGAPNYLTVALRRVRSGMFIQIRQLPNGQAYWHVNHGDGTGYNWLSASHALAYYNKMMARRLALHPFDA